MSKKIILDSKILMEYSDCLTKKLFMKNLTVKNQI